MFTKILYAINLLNEVFNLQNLQKVTKFLVKYIVAFTNLEVK